MTRRNWEDLANAIILEAVLDYRKARKKARNCPDDKEAQTRIREVERFLRSRWFAQLTDVDGEILLDKLKEEERETNTRMMRSTGIQKKGRENA